MAIFVAAVVAATAAPARADSELEPVCALSLRVYPREGRLFVAAAGERVLGPVDARGGAVSASYFVRDRLGLGVELGGRVAPPTEPRPAAVANRTLEVDDRSATALGVLTVVPLYGKMASGRHVLWIDITALAGAGVRDRTPATFTGLGVNVFATDRVTLGFELRDWIDPSRRDRDAGDVARMRRPGATLAYEPRHELAVRAVLSVAIGEQRRRCLAYCE